MFILYDSPTDIYRKYARLRADAEHINNAKNLVVLKHSDIVIARAAIQSD